MHGYADLLQALKGEPSSSAFSWDGSFNFCVRTSPLGDSKKRKADEEEKDEEEGEEEEGKTEEWFHFVHVD